MSYDDNNAKHKKESVQHMTRVSKSSHPNTVEMDMNKHIINTLNKYEDGPDIVEEVIRTSPIPVKGYGGGKTPSKKPQYPTQATPEQVARLAYNMEKSRQMTGADGRYDKPKAIIKKKKVSIITSYPKIQFTTYEPFIAAAQTPLQMQQEQNFKKLLQEREAEKIKKKYAGIAGLIGGTE